jgi:ABC-type multidrug transport system ATPase subunit
VTRAAHGRPATRPGPADLSVPPPAADAAPGAAAPGLAVAELEVRYPAFVLGPVTLRLATAQIFCLLGPNGSGKTTLIRSLLGLHPPHRGGADWRGRSLAGRPPEVFARIGYVTDSPEDVIVELTAEEYWEYCALGYTRDLGDTTVMLARARRLARRLDLVPPRRAIAGLSLGMRRKVQLVAGLMHAPNLVVLDEPLIGLDFLSIRALEDVLQRERARGALVVISSHDLGVAGRLADRIGVLHLGRLVLDAPCASLTAGGDLVDAVERVIRSARLDC